jgi:hypothetical protein
VEARNTSFKDSKKHLISRSQRGSQENMARRVDNEPKSCSNQTIFPYSSRQTKIQNQTQSKNNSGADWARDNEGILASVPPE